MSDSGPPDAVDPEERDGVDGYEWFNLFDSPYAFPKQGDAFRCPKCGTTLLECFRSGPYETAVRCPVDKVWTVVHDG